MARDTAAAGQGTSSNRTPLGHERFPGRSTTTAEEGERDSDTGLPAKPVSAPPAVTKTYESKAQVRDLRKEATQRFVPAAVRRKIEATKGVGGKLLEEEEVARLEEEGYGASSTSKAGGAGGPRAPGVIDAAPAVADEDGEAYRALLEEREDVRRLKDEEEAFRRALQGEEMEGDGDGSVGRRRVQMEEVSDEDL